LEKIVARSTHVLQCCSVFFSFFLKWNSEKRGLLKRKQREASKVGHYKLESNKDNESMLKKGVLNKKLILFYE